VGSPEINSKEQDQAIRDLECGEFHVVRILVADDNPTLRHYLRFALEQRSGWRVCDEAKTGGEVLQKVQNAHPDIILLDFQMPELNGLDIASQISRFLPDIPILMVTIHFSKQLALAARSVGIRGACAKSELASIMEGVEFLLHGETYFPEICTNSV
jgi:two-component system invasion response regulator UvrY